MKRLRQAPAAPERWAFSSSGSLTSGTPPKPSQISSALHPGVERMVG